MYCNLCSKCCMKLLLRNVNNMLIFGPSIRPEVQKANKWLDEWFRFNSGQELRNCKRLLIVVEVFMVCFPEIVLNFFYSFTKNNFWCFCLLHCKVRPGPLNLYSKAISNLTWKAWSVTYGLASHVRGEISREEVFISCGHTRHKHGPWGGVLDNIQTYNKHTDTHHKHKYTQAHRQAKRQAQKHESPQPHR